MLEEMLLAQIERYPHMEAEDALLLIYESAGYGEITLDSYDYMTEIEREGNALAADQLIFPHTEPIGGGYCRMNLSVLQVLPVDVLGRMALASKKNPLFGAGINTDLVQEGVKLLNRFCDEGKLVFSSHRLNRLLSVDPEKLRHSASYLEFYAPSYRVVREEFGTYLEVFVKISRLLSSRGEVTVAIDGQSGAGKTTLSSLIAAVFDANLFCTEQFITAAGFDYKQFRLQICENLNKGKPFVYESLTPKQHTAVPPKRLNVVEGVYSMHPALEKYYELKVFLSVTPLLQTKRILRDKGEELFIRFAEELIPREKAYIESQKVDLKCDLVFHIG